MICTVHLWVVYLRVCDKKEQKDVVYCSHILFAHSHVSHWFSWLKLEQYVSSYRGRFSGVAPHGKKTKLKRPNKRKQLKVFT